MYPKAPVYTSYCSPDWQQKLNGTQVITSYMQHWPFSKLRKFLPVFRAIWFSRLKLDGFDLVISSSGAEAKGVRTGQNTVHVCYMHAPTHYYWSRYEDYMEHPGFGALDPVARLGLKILVGPMRRWDRNAAQRPDHIIANSDFTKSQIKKYYGRESIVIHPPVDIDRFKLLNKSSDLRNGFLAVGRQTPYKRIDLAVAACTELSLPLTVIGSGPDHNKLRKIAGPSIKFVTNADDEEIVKYFQSAQAFIFPGVDDFGIVAVEALAAGTPVIAYKAGGALDYINPGHNGELFTEQTIESLANVLSNFNPGKFKSYHIQQTANEYSVDKFRNKFKGFINTIIKR